MDKNIFTFRVNKANAVTYALTNENRSAEIAISSVQDRSLEDQSCTNDGFLNAMSHRFGSSSVIPKGKYLILTSVKAGVEGFDDVKNGYGLKAFEGSIVATNGTDSAEAIPFKVAEYGKEYPLHLSLQLEGKDEWGIVYGEGSKFSIEDIGVASNAVGLEGYPYLEFTATIEDEIEGGV